MLTLNLRSLWSRKRWIVKPNIRGTGFPCLMRCYHCQSGGYRDQCRQSKPGWLFRLWMRAPPTCTKDPAINATSRTADSIGQTCIFPHSQKKAVVRVRTSGQSTLTHDRLVKQRNATAPTMGRLFKIAHFLDQRPNPNACTGLAENKARACSEFP